MTRFILTVISACSTLLVREAGSQKPLAPCAGGMAAHAGGVQRVVCLLAGVLRRSGVRSVVPETTRDRVLYHFIFDVQWVTPEA